MSQQATVIFDGECSMCNRSVRFIVRHDPDRHFVFAPADSEAGRQLLEHHGIDREKTQSIVLIENGEALVRSDAVLRIASKLKAPWRWTYLFRFVPRPLRDGVYRVIAKYRHRIMPSKAACGLKDSLPPERRADVQ